MSVLVGEFKTFPRGNGPQIRFNVIGDECCARYETLDGCTVVYDPKVDLSRFDARHADYRTVFRFETDKPSEYFLVENRSRIELDTHLPADGLAVCHCDTPGFNEWEGGTGVLEKWSIALTC